MHAYTYFLKAFCAWSQLHSLAYWSKGGSDLSLALPSLYSCSESDSSSRPLSYHSGGGGYCPAPPLLLERELNEEEDPQLSGPLDSHNHFVDEHLLRRGRKLERSVFFRRVQAGFVFVSNEPTDGECVSYDPGYNVDYSENSDRFSENNTSLDRLIPSKVYSGSSSVVTIWYNNQVRQFSSPPPLTVTKIVRIPL